MLIAVKAGFMLLNNIEFEEMLATATLPK